MQTGIVVLVVLAVMIFAQVVLLARASRLRHDELADRLDRIERAIGERPRP